MEGITALRIALVGKGGAGKSVISGTLARVFARRGHRVLALDVDTMPGLALSLGLRQDVVGDAGLPEELGERQAGRGWVLQEGVDVAALVAQHAVSAPEGVRFLQLGKLPGRVRAGSTTAFRAVLEQFRAQGWTLIGDLAAGTRQPFFGWGDFAEIVLVVSEPSAKAALAARRLAGLAHRPAGDMSEAARPAPIVGLVVNKAREERDVQRVQHVLGDHELPLMAMIPYDEQLAAAERLGSAPIDGAPGSAAVRAIEALAARLEQLTVARRENKHG